MTRQWAFIFFILELTGCSAARNYAPVRSYQRDLINGEKYYTVKKGDTLYSIGFRSGKGYQRLSKWNKVAAPYNLRVGQKIWLAKPRGKANRKAMGKKRRQKQTKKRGSSHKKSSRGQKERYSSQKTSMFSTSNKKVLKLTCQWPIKKKILKTFSQTGNKGIDIHGQVGQKVRSACSGKVVYSGSALKGYGNLLIIKHNYLYLSAYANNRRVFVKEGQLVKKGQVIAEVGLVEGKPASLHFEIRKNGKPVNPLNYLPKY
jgi:lipoprotein NlpD